MTARHRLGCDTCNAETNFLKPTIGQLHNLCDRLQEFAATKTELHKSRWECTTRAEEVQQLQQALSAAHLAILEERQALLHLKAENDVLRVQQLEDRHTIQRLQSARTGTRRCTVPCCVDKSHPHCQPRQEGHGQAQAVTTAQLRDASTVLTLKVTALEARLQEQNALSTQRIAALQQELQLAHTHAQQHSALLRQQLTQCQQQLQSSNTALRTTITQCTTLAKDHAAAQQALQQAQASVQGVKVQGEDALAAAQRKHTQQLRKLKAASEKQVEQAMQSLRQQVQEASDQYTELHNLHVQVVGQLQHENQSLQARALRCERENDALSRRRAMDTEGFSNDIVTLRKALQGLERRVRAWMLRPQTRTSQHTASSHTMPTTKKPTHHPPSTTCKHSNTRGRGSSASHKGPFSAPSAANTSTKHNNESKHESMHWQGGPMAAPGSADAAEGDTAELHDAAELQSIQQEALLLAEAMQHLERKLQEQQEGWLEGHQHQQYDQQGYDQQGEEYGNEAGGAYKEEEDTWHYVRGDVGHFTDEEEEEEGG